MLDRRDQDKVKRLEAMRDKFEKGQLLDREDFKAVGFSAEASRYAIRLLKAEYELDILTVCRGKAIVGWILADEIL